MKTERITADLSIEPIEAPRAVARSTKMLSARLPLDLHEHLKRVATAGGIDITLTLCGILRLHRDGTLNRSERESQARISALESQVGVLKKGLTSLADSLEITREQQAAAAARTEQLLSSLVDLLSSAEVEEVEEAGGRAPTPAAAPAVPASNAPPPANPLPAPVRYRP